MNCVDSSTSTIVKSEPGRASVMPVNRKMREGHQSPTIGSIARLTGVSTATVSYALSGRGRVSAKKAKEINAVAAKIGYVPKHAALALRNGRTSIIGLIVPNITNPIFTAMAQAIDECLHERGYGVLLADSKNRRQGQNEAIRNLSARGADALIIIPRHDTKVITAKNHIVVIDVPGRSDHTVCSDHHAGGRLIADHMLELGHRNILIMAGPENSAVAQARLAGMLEVFDKDVSAKPVVHHSPYGPDAANTIMAGVRPSEFTAVVAVSDTLAVGALRYLTGQNVKVPEQISVSGFDDTIWTELCTPQMTTVHQNVLEIAQQASALAVGETDQSVTIPVELIVRGSTGPVASIPINCNSQKGEVK